MRVFRVTLPYFYQIDTDDQTAVMQQLVSLFAGPAEHVRFLTFVMPASLERLEQERRRLAMTVAAGSPLEERARRGLMEEVRMIGEWGRRGTMRKTRHFLVDFDDALTAADLAYWRVLAEEGYPRLPVPGDYAEYRDHLAPVVQGARGARQTDNSRPYYAILASYQLSRSWDWRHPLAQTITGAEGQMVICIDVRKVHPERVAGAAEFWQGMVWNGQDRNAATALQEAEAALAVRDEAVHQVRVLFLLLERRLDRLRERMDALRKASAQYMKVDRLLGYQAAAAQLFGPAARPAGMPSGHFNTLSRAPAVFAGMWGVGREQRTAGYYVGLSVDEVAPHVHYLDWQGNDPFHGIILGRTGKGKTVGAQALAWRMAEQGVQVVLLEPQGHSRRLYRLATGDGPARPGHASYHHISYADTHLNILDVVHGNASDQYDHVLTLLGLLLDPLGHGRRTFTNAEVAAVRHALQLTYANYDWAKELLADHTLTPTLDVFCHKLRQVAETGPAPLVAAGGARTTAIGAGSEPVRAATLRLAAEIEGLYVHGDYAGNFNVPTNLDLTLQERIVLFDFSHVPERRRPLFYYAVLAGINHQIRRHPRRRAVIVDEVHYMSREGALMALLAGMVKTVRTYGAAVILVDQDLEAFAGVDGAQAESMAAGMDIAAGQFILNNVSWTIAFGMKRDAAYRLARHYKREILPSHAEFLARMGSDIDHGKGMAVVRADGKADMVYFQLRPTEAAYLFGS